MRKHPVKEYDRLLKKLVSEGWAAESGKGHYRIRSPGGKLLTISISPRCPHAFKNTEQDVRRIKREEELDGS